MEGTSQLQDFQKELEGGRERGDFRESWQGNDMEVLRDGLARNQARLAELEAALKLEGRPMKYLPSYEGEERQRMLLQDIRESQTRGDGSELHEQKNAQALQELREAQANEGQRLTAIEAAVDSQGKKLAEVLQVLQEIRSPVETERVSGMDDASASKEEEKSLEESGDPAVLEANQNARILKKIWENLAVIAHQLKDSEDSRASHEQKIDEKLQDLATAKISEEQENAQLRAIIKKLEDEKVLLEQEIARLAHIMEDAKAMQEEHTQLARELSRELAKDREQRAREMEERMQALREAHRREDAEKRMRYKYALELCGDLDKLLVTACQNGQHVAVGTFLELGANPSAKNSDKHTGLHVAAREGYPEVARVLLDGGANVNAKHGHNYTSLSLAALYDHVDIVQMLVERGAALEARNNEGWTPLHWASAKGHVDVVKVLLDAGANVKAKNNNGDTPLVLALSRNHPIILELLKQHGG